MSAIAILGPLTVDGDGIALAPRDRVVLEVLALRPGEVVSAERLADALWGQLPPASWTKVIQGCVVRLRKVLGTATIETGPHGYRLAVPADEVDARRFERLLNKGHELLDLGEPERASYLFGEALALWRGPALSELEEWDAGRIEARRLEEMRLEAEEARLDAMLRAGRYREVCAEAHARVGDAPLRERRWALLALAQYQAGLQGDALRTLRRARTTLETELGLDPGPELIELEQSILRQDPSLIAAIAPPEPSTTCPYPGLMSYDVVDADAFFGRHREVTDCLRRLSATGVLAVVGPSGCGKSSVVRAGVAAAIERDGGRVILITPGAHPMDMLGSLPSLGPGPVLVVDQCEEAVSLCSDHDERARFFAAVAAYAERAPVVIAVRADLLGEVSNHPGFARVIERGLYLLGPMDHANLRAAIEGPARQAGLLLEPGLIDLLTRDVEGEPGALPLLSHAMRQTWERREGRTLTVAGYRETGGIHGAVAQSAEAVYERVAPDQRPLLRDLLLRLVAPSPDGEPLRGRVHRRTLAIDSDHDELIEQLVVARLVTSDDGIVELAHEALARAWPRLRAWLDDDVEGQRILRHLTATADAWDVMGRPDSELYRGVRLARSLAWRDSAHADLTTAERAFLDAAEQLAEAERISTEEESRRQRRAKGRRRSAFVGVGGLLVAAMIAGVLAVRQSRRADTAAVVAEAHRVGALALDAQSVDRALLLGVEAVRLDDSPETRSSLLATLLRGTSLIRSVVNDDPLATVDVSPDGAVVVAGADFYDNETFQHLGGLDPLPWKMAYRADGKQVAMAVSTWSPSGPRLFAPIPVLLVDPTSYEPQPVQLGGLPEGSVEAWDLEYSADGGFLAVSLDVYDGPRFQTTVMVWDVARPEQPVQSIEAGQVGAITLNQDGSLLYVVAHDPPALTIYDVSTARKVRSIDLGEEMALGSDVADSPADGLEISPDGTTLAVMAVKDAIVLDAITLVERERLRGHSAVIQSLQFSRDGTLLASGSDDHVVIVWDVATGTQQQRLLGHSDSVWGLAFSPDDATLYSASIDHRLLVWDLRGDRKFVAKTAPFEPGQITTYALPAPDGEAVVHFTNAWRANDGGSTIHFLDVGTQRVGKSISSEHATWSPSWRPPAAERLATAGPDGTVNVWDVRRNEMVAEAQLADDDIAEEGVDYTGDGKHIVIGDDSGTVFQVDSDTLEPTGPSVEVGDGLRQVIAGDDHRRTFVMMGETFASIDFADGTLQLGSNLGLVANYADVSPDGRWLAVGATSGEVGVVDVSTGEWVRAPVAGHSIVFRVAYAKDGATFATSGLDGRVILWDGHTGALLSIVSPGRANGHTIAEFLDDGHTVVITDIDGAIHTWNTSLDYWIESACSIAGRNLTPEEWTESFGDTPYRETCSLTPE